MAAWVKFRNDRLTQTQRQNMLDTEFGGMNEVLTNLYQLTENPTHLTAAQYFDHAEIFDPLASNVDSLNNYHANTQIPKITGAIREYHATGTTRYRDIATNFWDIVVGRHSYAIGGNSNGEYFQPPNAHRQRAVRLDLRELQHVQHAQAHPAAVPDQPDPGRLPRLLRAGRCSTTSLASQNPSSSHGFQCYYVPLRPGGMKTYSNDYNNWTCCHGTGMESNTKYAENIYYHSGDTLYVAQFIASQLNWAAKGITVRQDTTFPEAGSTRLTFGAGRAWSTCASGSRAGAPARRSG